MSNTNDEEIRAVRKRMSAQSGHDVRKLIALINERRDDYADRVINPGNAAEQTAPLASGERTVK